MSRDPSPPTDPPPPDSPTADPAARTLNLWLVAGIALRLVVLLTASPFNLDRHVEVIEFIARDHALPTSNVIDQSYQPPLYYLLMTPLYVVGGPRLVHVATFAISCAALWLIRLAMGHPRVRSLVPSRPARVVAFALCATLPQFAICSGFISNDALASLVGAGLFLLTLAYADAPTRGRLVALAGLVAVGLLTKGTLLLSGAALAVVVASVVRREGRDWRRTAGAVALFCAIWATLGSYKYVENTARLGRPIVHNQDRASETALLQRNTWRGWRTAVEVNVLQLVRRPVIRAYDPPSYPLLLYGTFWYPYIPEPSYPGNLVGYEGVGSLTYAVAVVPTLAFVLGVAVAARQARRDVAALAALALLGANLAVVLAAGVRYDNWSSFHARLLFASAGPIAVLFGIGLAALARWPALGRTVRVASWATVACGLLYVAVEVLLRAGMIEQGPPLQWW